MRHEAAHSIDHRVDPGNPGITARSDVYSPGSVTYEMLTGEPPFTGVTAQQILARVRTEEPRAIAAQRRHVTPHVEAAVLTALEKLPADRFESAVEFARALSDPGFRGTARTGATAPRIERSGYRTLVVSLGARSLALAAVAAWGWLRAGDSPQSVVRFTLILPRDISIVTTSATGNIAVSPDGKVVVFTASAADGTQRLYARTLDEPELRILAGTEGAVQPFFSPDGRWIGFWSGTMLQKVAAEGGLPQVLTAMHDGSGATWTSHDVIVFAAAGRLYALPGTGGTPALLSARDSATRELFQMYPVALSDGDHVLYSSFGSDGVSIGLASLSAHSAKSLGIRGTNALGVIDGRLIYATRDNTLMAAPFDVSAGRTTGSAVPVATGVSVGVVGSAKAALSLSGTLAYRGGGRGSRMVLTSGGIAAPMVLPETRVFALPDSHRTASVSQSALTREPEVTCGSTSSTRTHRRDSRPVAQRTRDLSGRRTAPGCSIERMRMRARPHPSGGDRPTSAGRPLPSLREGTPGSTKE